MYQDEKNAESSRSDQRQSRNLFDAIRRADGPLLGAALTIPSTFVAQIIGQTHCDFVFLDMEHTPMSPDTMTDLVHAIVSSSAGRVLPLVRIPSQGVEWIKWALDSGAAGIIVPMVNDRAEVEQIVAKALFPPKGKRSFGPARAPWGMADGARGGVATYFQRALGGEIAILPMVESEEGLANVEEIVSVDGISGVFIGPMDLRLALGFQGGDGAEPPYTAALSRIVSAAKKEGKLVGSLGMNAQIAEKFARQGMDFVVVSVDTAVLSMGINAGTKEAAKVTRLRG